VLKSNTKPGAKKRGAGNSDAKNCGGFKKEKIAVLAIAVLKIAMFKLTMLDNGAENEMKMKLQWCK
jgi:hypothetical protein